MNRWDADCQICTCNIGDYWSCESRWYVCPQDRDHEILVNSHLPVIKFKLSKGKVTADTKMSKEELKAFSEIIVSLNNLRIKNEKNYTSMWNNGHEILELDDKNHTCKWLYEKYQSKIVKAIEKKYKIIPHIIKGSGRDRLGFTICEACAKKIKYVCPTCKSKLVLVDGKNHPGGQFELRDGSQKAAPVHHALVNFR